MIFVKTPFRISFLGGGTDHPIWFHKNPGLVISTAINKYCYIIGDKTDNHNPDYRFFFQYLINEKTNSIKEIKHKVIREALSRLYKDEPSKLLKIIHTSDLPSKSGIGSSSSFSVSLIHLILKLQNKNLNKKSLIKKTIDFEYKHLKEFVGYQDQIAAVYGGFNIINFNEKKFRIKKLNSSKFLSNFIKNQSLLIHSGIYRFADQIEKSKFNNLKINSDLLKSIYEIAYSGKKILNKSVEEFVKELPYLMNESWKLKKKLGKNVSNPIIDNIMDYCLKNGATTGKLLGAGGGGFLFFLFRNQKQRNYVAKIFKRKKFFVVDNLETDNSGSISF